MLLIIKLKISEVEDSDHKRPNLILFLLTKADLIHWGIDVLEVGSVVDVGCFVALTLIEVAVVLRTLDSKGAWSCQSIKGVVGPFIGRYWDDSAFLKEVANDVGSLYSVIFAKKDLNILSKPTGVVVSHSFAVPESLQQWVTGEDLLFDWVAFLVT